jgi:predicted small lipoprotein YifL
MPRFVVIVVMLAVGAGLAGCGSSPLSRAPAAQVAPSASPYAIPGSSMSQYECMTDEGDGRFMPCGARSF